MKKLFALVMVLVWVIAGANLTAAESISLRGGFAAGNAGLEQSNLRLATGNNGFYISATAQAETLPIHVTGSYYRLNPDEIPVSAMAGYKLNAGGSAGHVLVGYGNSMLAGGLGWAMHAFDVEDASSGQAITFTATGPAIGVFTSLPLAGQLRLAGELHYAPAVVVDANSAGASFQASKGTIIGYEVRGSLQTLPKVMLEAGYRQSRLTGAEGYRMLGGGAFAGAGILF